MPAKSALIPGEKVRGDDPRLFNMSDLAQILSVDRGTIRVMKIHGFKMPLGRSTIASAHTFLRKNPDIKSPSRPLRQPLQKLAE